MIALSAKKSSDNRRQEARLGLLLVAPALLAIATMALFPILRTIWISLHTQKLTEPGLGTPFVGLQNYMDLFQDADHRLWPALWHTIQFTAGSVGLELVMGLLIALLINREFKARGIVRASVLIPWAIPTVVSSLMWRFMFDDQVGLLNDIMVRLHLISQYKAWLGYPSTAMLALIITDVWKTTPFMALLLTAGLQVIPGDVYEAADVDGANAWTSFWRITLPLLKPTMLVALVFRTLDAFRVFDVVFIMTSGGPANSTETITVYAYKTLMRYMDFGHGSALATIIFLCVLLISYIYIRVLGANVGRE
ncbi:MAG: carbohydrate ABC transporter permease [Mycobacterium leprae]